jgi:hypothetical protein
MTHYFRWSSSDQRTEKQQLFTAAKIQKQYPLPQMHFDQWYDCPASPEQRVPRGGAILLRYYHLGGAGWRNKRQEQPRWVVAPDCQTLRCSPSHVQLTLYSPLLCTYILLGKSGRSRIMLWRLQ